MCLWKLGVPLQSMSGNHSHPEMIWGARNIPQVLYCNWWSSILETVVLGNLSSFLKWVKPLVLYDGDRGVVMEPMQGKLALSQFDFCTLRNFAFLGWHQCSSRLVTLLLGTLWSSIKQIEAPSVFDCENSIPLDTIQGNRASSRGEG